jgi:hypothetical protein
LDARAHKHGETYNNLFGWGSPGYTDKQGRWHKPTILVTHKAEMPVNQSDKGVDQKYNYNLTPELTLRHEFGHALQDAVEHMQSADAKKFMAELHATFAAEHRDMPPFKRAGLDYYRLKPEDTSLKRAEQETFAELFAITQGGGVDDGNKDRRLAQAYPRTLALMQKWLPLLQAEKHWGD